MVKASSWDEAMKEEVGVDLKKNKEGDSRRQTRAAKEKKSNRRQKATRWIAYSGQEALRQKMDSRLERLECTNHGDPLGVQEDEKDEENNDSDNFSLSDVSSDEDEGDAFEPNASKSRKRRKKTSNKSKAKKRRGGTKQLSKQKKAVAKKRKRKTLAEMLLDENAAKLNKIKAILSADPENTEQCSIKALDTLAEPDYFNATALPSRYPSRKFCVVTGSWAKYQDPESMLPYSSLKVYTTLKEQPPPWVRASISCPFHEALTIMKEDRESLSAKIKGRLKKTPKTPK